MDESGDDALRAFHEAWERQDRVHDGTAIDEEAYLKEDAVERLRYRREALRRRDRSLFEEERREIPPPPPHTQTMIDRLAEENARLRDLLVRQAAMQIAPVYIVQRADSNSVPALSTAPEPEPEPARDLPTRKIVTD